jgi:hypothetical protein
MGELRTDVIHRLVPAGIAVALLVTGCGSTSVAVRSDSGIAPQAADVATVNCGGSVYDPTDFADAPPASSLPDGPAGAVDDAGAPAFDASQDWKVVHHADDRVDLVRVLDDPIDIGGGDVRTHESLTLERIAGAINVADGTWFLTSASPCTQRLVTYNGLGEAELTLADAPSPGDASVDLLVTERACASGQGAEGRIELVEPIETAEQIQLRIGVRAPDGDAQTCQGNPPTPFTVELSEPLGEREIVDASVVPPRPVTVNSGQ